MGRTNDVAIEFIVDGKDGRRSATWTKGGGDEEGGKEVGVGK
jgi:hypothetical protein